MEEGHEQTSAPPCVQEPWRGVAVSKTDVEVRRAAELVAEGEAVLLDVREQDEWHAGHAPQALHIPMSELGERFGELPSDRPLLAVCRSGNRSGQVAGALRRAGYRVDNVAGGMQAWKDAGLPLEPNDGHVV
jgi:rhodanese-related sulfurtransferase